MSCRSDSVDTIACRFPPAAVAGLIVTSHQVFATTWNVTSSG
ncbi:MAG: hypothetical protein P8L34_02780 [Arenicellales bacterium]|nr:hypothetical protein [Arenicellales bacterium]